MYETITPVPLKASSSSLFNNLDILPHNIGTSAGAGSSVLRHSSYLSIYKQNVNIVQQNNVVLTHKQVSAKESSSNQPLHILQAKWCCLEKQTVLVLAHIKGVQIFDENGAMLLFWHNTLEKGVMNDTQLSYCRGIGSLHNTLFIGNCRGEILIVQCSGDSFRLSQTIKAHPSPIMAIATLGVPDNSEVNLTTADDDGSISMWRGDQSSKVTFSGSCTGTGYPCTSLCLLPNSTVIAGFYSGHIRIFDTTTCEKLVEIAAHARPVMSMDWAVSLRQEKEFTVISGSEDTFVRIWKITRKDKIKVEQEWFTSVKDLLICGVKFCDSDVAFGVTGYDSKEVTLFTRVS